MLSHLQSHTNYSSTNVTIILFSNRQQPTMWCGFRNRVTSYPYTRLHTKRLPARFFVISKIDRPSSCIYRIKRDSTIISHGDTSAAVIILYIMSRGRRIDEKTGEKRWSTKQQPEDQPRRKVKSSDDESLRP